MSAEEFRGWRLHMRITYDWDTSDIIRELGCGKNSIAVWSEKGAPRYIALACTALEHTLKPWFSTEDEILNEKRKAP